MFKSEENPYSTWLLESFLICHMCQLTNPSVFAIRNKNPCKEKEAQAIWLQIHFSKDRHSYQALKPLRPCYGWHSASGVNANGLSLAWIQPHSLLLRAKHEGLRSHYTTSVKSPSICRSLGFKHPTSYISVALVWKRILRDRRKLYQMTSVSCQDHTKRIYYLMPLKK